MLDVKCCCKADVRLLNVPLYLNRRDRLLATPSFRDHFPPIRTTTALLWGTSKWAVP